MGTTATSGMSLPTAWRRGASTRTLGSADNASLYISVLAIQPTRVLDVAKVFVFLRSVLLQFEFHLLESESYSYST